MINRSGKHEFSINPADAHRRPLEHGLGAGGWPLGGYPKGLYRPSVRV